MYLCVFSNSTAWEPITKTAQPYNKGERSTTDNTHKKYFKIEHYSSKRMKWQIQVAKDKTHNIKQLCISLLLLLTYSHLSACMCWDTYNYPRLLMGLGSDRARKFTLSPKVKGFRNMHAIWHICAAFCPILRIFLVKHTFCRYFRQFLVTTPSTEVTKGYTDTVLSFQIFLISRVKFSLFIIFSASVLGRPWVKATAIPIKSVILLMLLLLLLLT